MKKLLRIFEVTVLFMSILSCFVFAEDITITTYYPSPFGSYRDLQVTNKATFGPFSMFAPAAVVPGSIVLSGNTAGVYIVDRNLGAYPGTAGSAYAMYNLGGILRLWTPVNGDLITVNSNGNINILTPSQATADPLNGVSGYTAQPRFSDNNDTP